MGLLPEPNSSLNILCSIYSWTESLAEVQLLYRRADGDLLRRRWPPPASFFTSTLALKAEAASGWGSMSHNPSQLLPSGSFFLDPAAPFVVRHLPPLHPPLFPWFRSLRPLSLSHLPRGFRIDRSVHRVEDMGHNEGRQGAGRNP